MSDIPEQLIRVQHLRSESEVAAFETALANLPAVIDQGTVNRLLDVFTDDNAAPEVMFSLVHRLERTPSPEFELSIVAALPRLASKAPDWAETIIIRLLNHPESRATLAEVARKAPRSQRDALLALLRTIGERTSPVAGTARWLEDTLGSLPDQQGP